MRAFNAIQIVALLMASPTLLAMCKASTFAGASALFWLGLIVTVALFVWTVILVLTSLDRE